MKAKNKALKIGEFSEGTVELGADELNSENTKVRITMFLDGPLLKKYKDFARLTNGKYQTLINDCLNDYSDKYLDQELKKIKRGIQQFERKKA